jgi:ABC-type sugar transport system permease subunit
MKDFANMFIFLASDLFTALLPPLIFAFFLTIMRNKNYSALMRTLLFIPGIIPGVATTLLWREGIYGTSGVINTFVGFFTGENPKIKFLISPDSVALVRTSLIMMGFPFVGSYLIFYGAMMNVPDSYYEAAEMDGITVIKRFVFIDVPLIFAQIKYVFIMTFIGSVQNFGRTYMTETADWGVKTPVHKMYLLIKENGNYGQASAYATILFIFLFFATMINLRVQTKDNQVA